MPRVAVFVSDMHIGTNDELEDFSPENEARFVQFLGDQSEKHKGKEIDLVILGDFLDIWQVATKQEKTAQNSTDIAVEIQIKQEQDRVNQIIAAHKGIFNSLQGFLSADPRRRLFVIPGNHDHSLIHPSLQNAIRKAIALEAPSLEKRILFPNFYDAPDLRTYAEHGNQYDLNNDYDNFADFGHECPGFYFVRLFWNRLEPIDPNVDVDIWWNIFCLIWERRLWNLLRSAYSLFRQYRNDPREFERIDVPGVPFLATPGGLAPMLNTGKSMPEFPDMLFSEKSDPELIFSTDPILENRLRALYHDPSETEFRNEMDKILAKKFPHQAPQVPKEPVAVPPTFGILPDEYVTAVTGMFAPPGKEPQTRPMKGSALDNGSYDYVLFGHTHDEKIIPISGTKPIYFNTGSWTMRRAPSGGNASRLCYTTIWKSPDGNMRAEQKLWNPI